MWKKNASITSSANVAKCCFFIFRLDGFPALSSLSSYSKIYNPDYGPNKKGIACRTVIIKCHVESFAKICWVIGFNKILKETFLGMAFNTFYEINYNKHKIIPIACYRLISLRNGLIINFCSKADRFGHFLLAVRCAS